MEERPIHIMYRRIDRCKSQTHGSCIKCGKCGRIFDEHGMLIDTRTHKSGLKILIRKIANFLKHGC